MVARISTDVAGPPLPTDSDQLLGSEHAFPERRGEGKAHRLSTVPRTMGLDGGNQTAGGAALAWGWLDVVCTRPPRQPHPSALVAPGIRCVWLVGCLRGRSLGAPGPRDPGRQGCYSWLHRLDCHARPRGRVASQPPDRRTGDACRVRAPLPTIIAQDAATRRIRLSRPGTAKANARWILRALPKTMIFSCM